MKRLWVAAALAPLSFAASAHAQITISSSSSKLINTATINSGLPDDIVLTGSINPNINGSPSAQVAAITLNSNNSVTNNGSITTSNYNYVTGILAVGTQTGTDGISINNTGSIDLSESASQHVNGTNGIADGININGTVQPVFAEGVGRFGIQTGDGLLTGNLINSGSITIVGEASAGILIGTGGLAGAPVTGAFVGTGVVNGLTNLGTITVTGDSSYGIRSQGLITGNVEVSGAVSVTGQHSVGVALDQGATGNVDLSNAITVTGFHSLTPPVSLTQIESLTYSQLFAGGPAVTIGGSVGNGITIDAPAAAIAADGSTPAVNAVVGGAITAYGSTAMVIGSTDAGAGPITIGATNIAGDNGASLFIAGTVTSTGLYQNFNAEGIQIGSTNGSAVSLPGGIDITGSVSASSVAVSTPNVQGSDQGTGNVIGLQLMSGASTSSITVGAPLSTAGSLIASSTSTAANTSVTALQIDPGAVRPSGGTTLTNSGTIAASITGIAAVVGGQAAAGGTSGAATAISDQGGVLGQINNSGIISATITPIVATQTETGTTYAMDLRGNTAGVTVTQTQAPIIPAMAATSTTAATSATTPAAPSITGDVLFGSGNANLNLLAGTLVGAVSFGTGTNTFDLENGATMTGALTEASGGNLALTVGANGNNAVTSSLNNTSTTAVGLKSLNIGASGQVIFTLDPGNGVGAQFNVSGNANLAAGAKIGLNIISANSTDEVFTLVTAGTLTSATTAQALLGTSTYLFNETLTQTTGANGSITVDVSPKTAAQLGLNPSEAAAYPAILDVLQASNQDPQAAAITADVLSKTNKSDFTHLYDQFLPDFEGGPFDTLVVAQNNIAAAEADQPIKLQTDEVRGWVQEIGYLDNRQTTATTNGYRGGGFGIIGGLEQARGDGAVGVAASFITDGVVDDSQGPGANVSSTALEAGVYWRDQWGGLSMHASFNGGYVYMSSDRLLFDENSTGTVNLFDEAKSQWNGATASAEWGASYQIPVGKFYVRPEVIADYVYLYESAYTEHGGGSEMDLAVAARSSGEGTVQGDLVFGADLGGVYHWRPEMTLGWREVLTGGPGNTTARFVSGGPSFTLSPQFQEKGSLIARFGLRAGGNFADFSADAGGELNNTYQVYDARAVARFLF